MSEEKRLSQESGKEDTLKQNEKEMYIREIHTALEKRTEGICSWLIDLSFRL